LIGEKEELLRVLAQIRNLKYQAIIMLIYGVGSCVSEVVKLQVKDIDRDRKMLWVRGSKGELAKLTSHIMLNGKDWRKFVR